MALEFKQAQKFAAKGRVALIGPAGSGKSYTGLTLATLLAGPNGRIAAVDTEHGSLSKYADIFKFNVLELDSFSPDNFMAALKAAEEAKYDVFLCDSLSHFWVGKDGALEFVDLAAKKSRDGMAGWKEFRPHERAMVDAMIASPCHVICTMRTKTEYSEIEVDGKKKRVKVGLAPVQRDGLEYEFDLCAYMDDECNMVVDKTRCPIYSGKIIPKPAAKQLEPFRDWLSGASRATPAQVNQVSIVHEDAGPMLGGSAAQTQSAPPQQTQIVDNYISTDKARELSNLADLKNKGVDEVKMKEFLATIGYQLIPETNAWLCVKESQYEPLKKWIEDNKKK